MRKFLLPIINLVNVVLVAITFGLSPKTSVIDAGMKDLAKGNYYQLVWNNSNANVMGIIGFFLLCVAALATLVIFFPFKARKCVAAVTGLMYAGAGAMFLLTPKGADMVFVELEMTKAFITMIVLTFCVAAFTILMSVLEFTEKKEK